MDENNVSLDLMEFVEKNILPRYNSFDRAHNIVHVTGVIRRTLANARQLGADLNMAYTVAAYHDLGMEGPRAIHHLTGGKILANDARLKRWFSLEQIRIMSEAVEDHRASASHAPRSIYGKIVAEADRDLQPITVFRRTVQFGLANYPTLDREGQWKRFLEHMQAKYSEQGYIRLWIPNSPNGEKLKQIRNLINNPKQLRSHFDTLYDEETAIA